MYEIMNPTSEYLHSSMSEHPPDAAEEASMPAALFKRAFHRREPELTLPKAAVCCVIPFGVSLLTAILVGLVLNKEYFGSFNGGSQVTPDGQSINALKMTCVSAVIAGVMSIVRFLVRNYCHSRVYGVYSFIIYLILLGLFVTETYSGTITAVTTPHAKDFANQIYNQLDASYGSPASNFDGITKAEDFWSWYCCTNCRSPESAAVRMKGPFRDFLLAGPTNRDKLGQLNSPTLISRFDSSNLEGGKETSSVWNIPTCYMRQVRTTKQETDELVGVDGLKITYRTPDFEHSRQFKGVRGEDRRIMEYYVDNQFLTVWGKKKSAPDFTSSESGITYPGEAGQVPSFNHEQFPQEVPAGYTSITAGLLYAGAWMPNQVTNSTVFAESYDRVISLLDDLSLSSTGSAWIDEYTALVQVICNLWAPNIELQAYLTYSVEFLNSGCVSPLAPVVTMSKWPDQAAPDVSLILIVAFYYLAEEVQDLAVMGLHHYVVGAGWLNLMDIVFIISCLFTFIVDMIYRGMICYYDKNQPWEIKIWSQSYVQSMFQLTLGLTLFCFFFRGLKFSKNVPIMCRIGDTFSHTVIDISMFVIVIFVMFLAFGVLFNCVYAISQGTTLAPLCSLYSEDVDAMVAAQPVFGPLFYSIYVTVILFIAFTLMIAIISDSYDAVKEENPNEGFFVSLKAVLSRRSDSEVEPSDNAPAAESLPVEGRLSKLEAKMDQIVQLLQRCVDDNGESSMAPQKFPWNPDAQNTHRHDDQADVIFVNPLPTVAKDHSNVEAHSKYIEADVDIELDDLHAKRDAGLLSVDEYKREKKRLKASRHTTKMQSTVVI